MQTLSDMQESLAVMANSSSTSNYPFFSSSSSLFSSTEEDPSKPNGNNLFLTSSHTDYVSTVYKPATVESYILENAERLGYNTPLGVDAPACTIWNDPKETTIYNDLHVLKKQMGDYTRHIRTLSAPAQDLRLVVESTNYTICDQLGFPNGVASLFPGGQLSHVQGQGYIEPIVPPLRHPIYCQGRPPSQLLNLGYLVHDFPTICRSLRRTSRTIFVDMGASLQYHSTGEQPAVYLTTLYRHFGIPFDHIYAYERTPTPPEKVFDKLPDDMRAAYHWINVGVSPDPHSNQNPWKMLRKAFTKDDFIVVKLDIDTSAVEIPLVVQLLESPDLHELVDQFYFEHHVNMEELAPDWKQSRNGSIYESLHLFHELRKRGIAAHSWV